MGGNHCRYHRGIMPYVCFFFSSCSLSSCFMSNCFFIFFRSFYLFIHVYQYSISVTVHTFDLHTLIVFLSRHILCYELVVCCNFQLRIKKVICMIRFLGITYERDGGRSVRAREKEAGQGGDACKGNRRGFGIIITKLRMRYTNAI